MSSPGAGSQRIVVIGATGQRPPSDPPAAHAPREPTPRGEGPAQRRTMQASGWTPRRLAGAAGFGAVAVVAGGLVFVAKFGGDRGPGDNPFMAFAFGLFVIGMVVLCAALVALIGTGVSVIAEARGWAPVAAVAVVPLALLWLLFAIGAVGYAIPAVLSLLLIGGFIVALK